MLVNNPNCRCCYEEDIRTMLEEVGVVEISRHPFHEPHESGIVCGQVGAIG